MGLAAVFSGLGLGAAVGLGAKKLSDQSNKKVETPVIPPTPQEASLAKTGTAPETESEKSTEARRMGIASLIATSAGGLLSPPKIAKKKLLGN